MTQTTGTTSFPIPGRGCWTCTGGLLPATLGGTGAGFYRLNAAGESPIGAAYATGTDTGHDAWVVFLAVTAIQSLIGLGGGDLDGWFGARTSEATRLAQRSWKVEADGLVGRLTMRAALSTPIMSVAAATTVPAHLLGGLAVTESGLDPAAVGANGVDHGLVQINLSAHGEVSVVQAMDPLFSLTFAAKDLARVHRTWVGRTSADPWDVAIANHNSPALARRWAESGVAPFVPGRLFQIQDYVTRVKNAW